LVLLANTFDAPDEKEQQADYLMQAAAAARHSAVNPDERVRVLARLVPSAARLGRLDAAIDACRDGIDLARARNDRMLEGFFEGNLGSVLSQKGERANALEHLERSLTIARAIGDTEGIQIATHNIEQAKRTAQDDQASVPQPAKASGQPPSSSNGASRTVNELVAVARQWRRTDSRDKGPLARIGQPANPADAEAVVAAALDASDTIESDDPRLAALLVLAIEQWLNVPASPRTMTRLYSQLGGYATRGGDVAGAIKCYEAATGIARQNDLKAEFAVAATNLGSMLRRSGRTAEAADTYEAALRAAQDLGPRLRAMVLVNAATAWSDLGRKDRSILLSGEAVDILRREPDAVETLLVALINRGGALFSLNRIKEAEADITETLNLARSVGNKAQEGVALGHLGLIRFAQGSAADAIRYLERAAQQAEEAHDLWNAQHWYRDLGNAYIWTGFDEAAERSFEQALALSQRVSDLRSEAIAHLGLAISTRGSDRKRHSLNRAWELAIRTGNTSVAFQVACQGVQTHAGRAAGVDESMSLESLLALKGGFKLRNEKAFKEAKVWLERGQELCKIVGDDGSGQMRSAQSLILRLEGRVQEAINMLLEGIDEVTGLARTMREAGVGLLYFTGLERPDLALPHLERALIDFDKASQELRADEHRLAMRDETARVAVWTIECALAEGRTEKAFEVLERSKTREIRRLRATDRDAGPSEVPTLADVQAHLTDGRAAVVSFVLGTQSTHAFIVTADRVLDPIDVAFDAGGIAAKWLHVQTAYQKARSPAAAFDASLTRGWHQTLQDICVDLGHCLSVKLVPLLDSHGIRELILVPQSMLHSFPSMRLSCPAEPRWQTDSSLAMRLRRRHSLPEVCDRRSDLTRLHSSHSQILWETCDSHASRRLRPSHGGKYDRHSAARTSPVSAFFRRWLRQIGCISLVTRGKFLRTTTPPEFISPIPAMAMRTGCSACA
jgi:tetratricopeptide (TPR) repeat protein